MRQGCTLSPWLFNVFLDAIVKEARERFVEGVRMGNEVVAVLLFADDNGVGGRQCRVPTNEFEEIR